MVQYLPDLTKTTKKHVATATEIGMAVGNVGSHELGHMYGAVHIYDGNLYIMTIGPRPKSVTHEVTVNGQKHKVKFPTLILPWTWSPQSTARLDKKYW